MKDKTVKNTKNSERVKLAVVVSHPIQYYAPYYRAVASEGSVQIKVFFCSRIGLDEILDPRMGVKISWRTDLLSGYDYVFLPEAKTIKTTRFRDVNNPSITSHLEAYRPDVVLLHGYAHKTLVRALIWCRRHGVPVMMISDRSFFGLTTLMRRAARRMLLPLIVKQFTAFLVIGDAIHRFYESFGARHEQIFRVPNMLDNYFWDFRNRKEVERERVRAELGLNDEFVVLYVGKFIPLKRVQDLLSALEIVRERSATRRPIQMLFAGDGEMRSELENKAQKKPSSALSRFCQYR